MLFAYSTIEMETSFRILGTVIFGAYAILGLVTITGHIFAFGVPMECGVEAGQDLQQMHCG